MTSLMLALSVLLVTTVATMAALHPASTGAPDVQATWEDDSPFLHMIDETRLENPPPQETSTVTGSFRAADSFTFDLTTPALSLETDLWEAMARQPREVAVPEDRYIFKYKEGREADFKEAVEPLALELSAVARKVLPAGLRFPDEKAKLLTKNQSRSICYI
jgi:hypothetical protein